MTIKLAMGLIMLEKNLARHSVGAWFIEALANKHGVQLLSEPHLAVKLGKFEVNGDRFYCAINDCQLNDSGTAAQKLFSKLNININEVLIVHDDLRIMPGVARLIASNSKTGRLGEQHKGIIDIGNKCGKEFNRLRLGIGHPGIKALVPEYVSNEPIPEDRKKIIDAIDLSLECFPLMLATNLEQAMHYLHSPPARRNLIKSRTLKPNFKPSP